MAAESLDGARSDASFWHWCLAGMDACLFAGAVAWALVPPPDLYPYSAALSRLVVLQGMFLLARLVRARGVHAYDVLSLFVILAPCYAVVYPIIYNTYPFALFGLGESDFRRVFTASIITTLSFWFVALFGDSEATRSRLKQRLLRGLTRLTKRAASCRILFPVVAVLGLSVVYGYHLSQVGGSLISPLRDRGLFLYLSGDEAWWKVKYTIVALSIFLLLHAVGTIRRVRRGGKGLFHAGLSLASTFPFLLMSLSVGNRREPMYILLSGFLLALVFGGPLVRYSLPLLASGALAGLLYLGLQRSSSRPMSSETATLTILGEFVYPYQVTLVALEPGRPVLHGYSYLQPLTIFVPRSVWPGKPSLLSERFIDEVGTRGLLGYGYTPLAEAVANFGQAGPFILGAGIALLMFYVRRNAGKRPLVYLLLFAETVGLHRGEMAAIASEVVLFAGIIWLVLVIFGPFRPIDSRAAEA